MKTRDDVKKKSVDYTNRIKSLFHSELHGRISEKVLYLLPLLTSQADDVKLKMINHYVNNEFSFCFSKTDRQRSPDYVSIVKKILKDALFDGFDEFESKNLLLGLSFDKMPLSELKVLAFTVLFHEKNILPSADKIPNIMQFVNAVDHIQDSFQAIPDYKKLSHYDIVNKAIPEATRKMRHTDALRNASILLLAGILVIIAEAYVIKELYYAESEALNEFSSAIIGVFAVLNIVLCGVFREGLMCIDRTRIQYTTELAHSTSQVFNGKLPEVMVIEIAEHKKYMLPLFEPKPADLPIAIFEVATNNKEVLVTERYETSISVLSTFSRFIQRDDSVKPREKHVGDVIKIEGVVYRQLYNKDQIPTGQYVGYANDVLIQLTTADNIKIFKNLLDYPTCVAPKGCNGFVLRGKRASLQPSAAPFKLKSARENLRLLFSHTNTAKLNDKKIELYALSGAKTHNQMKR